MGLMQNKKYCYVCGKETGLHKHHIFYGTANRKLSEEDGCICYLCAFHHNGGDWGVHFNKDLDLRLKRECQRAWEEKNGTREDFIKRYGKSWL